MMPVFLNSAHSSAKFASDNFTYQGTAWAAAALQCLDTNAQTAMACGGRRLRSVTSSSRGSVPAGTSGVRVAPGREEWRQAACPLRSAAQEHLQSMVSSDAAAGLVMLPYKI